MTQLTEDTGEALSSAPVSPLDGIFSKERQLWEFFWEELKSFPGRSLAATRIVIAVVATVIASETLRIPFPSYSAYIIFFIASDDGVRSLKLGIMAMVGVTLTLGVSMIVSICFMDTPWFRLPVTLFLIAGAVWLTRALVLAVLGRLIAVILVLYLSLADTIFDPEELTESTLWLWSVVGVAVGITVLVSLILPGKPSPSPAIPSGERKKGMFALVDDALSNREYVHFAVKTILAVITCEIFMNAVAWPGIRTSMITCVVTALAAMEARSQKQGLRLLGACVGGLTGLGAIIYLVPHMDSIVPLLLVIIPCTFLFAWVAVGSPRLSYAGFQMALAFYIMLLPGFDTSIDLTSIRDRFVGIVIGIMAIGIFFDLLRPSDE